MTPDLPSPLLRSFVAVVECGSLVAASVRAGRSESALSLQMSRLEDIVGQPLFDRDGRALKLNGTGCLLLPHARAILAHIDVARVELGRGGAAPVRIGIVQDFVETVLRPVLADLRVGEAVAPMSIVIGSTAELMMALSEDRIDTALCVAEPVAGPVGITLNMSWFGNAELAEGDVIPLIGITPTCPFLAAAQKALDFAGRPWRMALLTPSLDGVRAAVQAGLGITCRTEVGIRLLPLDVEGLPRLPDISYSVIERRSGRHGPEDVALLLRDHLKGQR